MSPYEVFEHTADVGLRITATDVNSLFAEAARGFFWLIVENLEEVRSQHERRFSLQAQDIQYLLVDWLSELLVCFETERLVLASFDLTVRQNDETASLEAVARGEPLDWERHETHLNIKAVTYHNLRVEQTSDGWVAEVIFDI